MGADNTGQTQLEIAHVLFIDIVGYSKLLTNEQRERVAELNAVVRSTEQFRSANDAGKLICLTTGDGIALAFFNTPDAPARCASQITSQLRRRAHLPLRMGIHSGPVSGVTDVNDKSNIAGAGINMAQRVMDCGDAGHILLSKRIADDLEQYPEWRDNLHDLGSCEVKHGVKLHLVSLWNNDLGNSTTPSKLLAQRGQSRRRQWALLGCVSALLLVIGSFLLSRSAQKSGSPMQRSVAVLPFENLSEEKENAYFAGGVQDEILSDLSKIADLKVISRTSVMKYKSGPGRNLRGIAKTLGVSHVVEGSVQRAGQRIRITAQLIDARNDTHAWAEHYDRDLNDVLAVQSEIAQRIADQLRVKLSAEESAAITERPTADLVAYAYYTKAKELDLSENWEGDEKNLNQQVELLEKAIQRDPNFALAYCALAKAQIDLSSMLQIPRAQDISSWRNKRRRRRCEPVPN